VSYTFSLTGIDNTNAGSTVANDMADIMVEGARLWAVRRRGKKYSDAFAAGDKVEVVPFTVGKKTQVASEANSVLRSMWNCFIFDDVQTDDLATVG
jgi:hypothetical protein